MQINKRSRIARHHRSESTCFVLGLVFILSCLQTAIVQAEPFISGFDRFGKHQEISETLSNSLLVSELNCTRCHASDSQQFTPKGAPDLTGAGTQFSLDWLVDYIQSPTNTKPGTTMPDLLHGQDKSKKRLIATAIAHFLKTKKRGFPQLKATGLVPVKHEFWLKGDATLGRQLYHSIGCVACHDADEDYETANAPNSSLDQLLEQLAPDELKELGLSGKARVVQSVPHGRLEEKYSLLSLTHFLLNPQRSRPAGRMPNLKLQPTEAADIAAYLLEEQTNDSNHEVLVDEELAKQGEKLFVEVGCANCHELDGMTSKPLAKSFQQLDFSAEHSCIDHPEQIHPNYSLSEGQTSSLKQILEHTENWSPESRSLLTMLQLNCYGCHERDNLGGVGRKRQPYFETVGHVDIGDEGRLPPQLTHVGQKLNPTWFKKVLDGKGDIRPHMTIRMPIFPKANVQQLPSDLAKVDGVNAATEKVIFGESKNLAQPGRELLNTGCIQCHPLRGESLSSVVGTDLNRVHERVNPAWFKQFLLNPISLKERTRMPTFFPNGVSSNPNILNGDVDQQIAAIWAYLKENEKHPLPEKIIAERAKNFELVPEEKPIVLRTFMEKAGTHAIAVGLPEGLNYAYDSEKCQLVEAWKGRFLDAHGTWYNRFTPLAEPLGTDRIDLTTRLSVSITTFGDDPKEELKKLSQRKFLGYSLDDKGLPTFQFLLAGRIVEEKVIAEAPGELRRQVKIRSAISGSQIESPQLKLMLFSAPKLNKQSHTQVKTEDGLSITLHTQQPQTLMMVSKNNFDYALSSVPLRGEVEFEVVYKW